MDVISMLRDSPYIIGLIMLIGAFIGVGTIWYVTDMNEDASVNTLNDTLRATAISQVDLASRVDPGHVFLNQSGEANMDMDHPDFETEFLTHFNGQLTTGSIVRFDYVTKEDDESRPVPAMTYEYSENETGDVAWTPTTAFNIAPTRPLDYDESIEGIRVRIRNSEQTLNVTDVRDPDFWSYQSTVEVNRSDRIVTKMEDE